MEDFKSEEQLKELIAQLDENGSKGLIYENILLLRDAVKTYPTNYQLQFRLVQQLTFCQYKNGRGLSEEEQISLNREAAEIGNRILSHCTDGVIINQTTQQLCYIYSRLGEKEKAIEYAMIEGDYELALSSLEKAAEFAIMSDTLPEKAQHTSLLVKKLEYNPLTTIKNYDFTNCKVLYDKMQMDRYDAIRDDKRFIAVLEEIS